MVSMTCRRETLSAVPLVAVVCGACCGMLALGVYLVYLGDEKYIVDVMVLGAMCVFMAVTAFLLSMLFVLRPLYRAGKRLDDEDHLSPRETHDLARVDSKPGPDLSFRPSRNEVNIPPKQESVKLPRKQSTQAPRTDIIPPRKQSTQAPRTEIVPPRKESIKSSQNPESVALSRQSSQQSDLDALQGGGVQGAAEGGAYGAGAQGDLEAGPPVQDLYQPSRADTHSSSPVQDLYQPSRADTHSSSPVQDLYQPSRADTHSSSPVPVLPPPPRTLHGSDDSSDGGSW